MTGDYEVVSKPCQWDEEGDFPFASVCDEFAVVRWWWVENPTYRSYMYVCSEHHKKVLEIEKEDDEI
tara:strand:- start:443 stop:643 length:201 start_codon:yes stop_codon:yes gene_type:complete